MESYLEVQIILPEKLVFFINILFFSHKKLLNKSFTQKICGKLIG